MRCRSQTRRRAPPSDGLIIPEHDAPDLVGTFASLWDQNVTEPARSILSGEPAHVGDSAKSSSCHLAPKRKTGVTIATMIRGDERSISVVDLGGRLAVSRQTASELCCHLGHRRALDGPAADAGHVIDDVVEHAVRWPKGPQLRPVRPVERLIDAVIGSAAVRAADVEAFEEQSLHQLVATLRGGLANGRTRKRAMPFADRRLRIAPRQEQQ